MPSIYSETVNKKVNPYASGYDPNIEIKDYYDADGSYPNPIIADSPSVEIHQFEDVYPRLGTQSIISAVPFDTAKTYGSTQSMYVNDFLDSLLIRITTVKNENEKTALRNLYNAIDQGEESYHAQNNGGSYTFKCDVTSDTDYYYIKYTSDNVNYDVRALKEGHSETSTWDDTMNDDGEYVQSYFKTFSCDPIKPAVLGVAFILITHFIIIRGVRNGIERASKLLMPLLFVLLLIIVIASCSLPGALKGVEFLLKPDFSKVSGKVCLEALGQAFFSLSLGTACLCTYASYFSRQTRLLHSATQIAIIDFLIALMSGLMIFLRRCAA